MHRNTFCNFISVPLLLTMDGNMDFDSEPLSTDNMVLSAPASESIIRADFPTRHDP